MINVWQIGDAERPPVILIQTSQIILSWRGTELNILK